MSFFSFCVPVAYLTTRRIAVNIRGCGIDGEAPSSEMTFCALWLGRAERDVAQLHCSPRVVTLKGKTENVTNRLAGQATHVYVTYSVENKIIHT